MIQLERWSLRDHLEIYDKKYAPKLSEIDTKGNIVKQGTKSISPKEYRNIAYQSELDRLKGELNTEKNPNRRAALQVEFKKASDRLTEANKADTDTSFDIKKRGEWDFVKAKDGSIDFGHMPNESRREVAPIRLQKGNDDFGKHHIEIADNGSRLKAIKNEGYTGVEDFIQDVVTNYNKIRVADSGRLMLIKENGNNKIAVVELRPHDDGAFYGVTTGGIHRKGYANDKPLLLDRGASPTTKPEQPSPLPNANADKAQDTNALRTGKSNAIDSTLPHPAEPVKISLSRAHEDTRLNYLTPHKQQE